ncbi:peroxisomal leader peptide-processing protease [Wyeomyia smithii]|uniref:peroxisomal leader peptide-processing protease n=1 Tax=Wyeomyia smithii TaxID=174621 RepID=UPI0024681832|nr:peroxisomal leader peptide-processing protease [Wyeomyia smithii]
MKNWFPSHGIIYCRTGSYKNSAIIFPNGLILTSGLTLLQVTNSKDALYKMPDKPLIHARDPEISELDELDFRMIIPNPKNGLTEFKARIAFIVFSKFIEASIRDCSALKFLVDGKYERIGEYIKFFSSFLLLRKFESNISLEQTKQVFLHLMDSTNYSLNIIEEIICVSTPFGNEHFMNTVNLGHVANVFGTENCLALLNVQTAFGCEGGGVYDKQLNLRSVLLGSCFYNENDIASFPLAANITEIFRALFSRSLTIEPARKNIEKYMESVCLIDSMNCWGTGCIFQIKGRNLVITCSHVVKSDNIVCYVKGCEYQLKLLYKNPIYDSAYDIAILELADCSNSQKIKLCHLATYVPKVGQRVYAIGFPLFKIFGLNENFKPSIFCGRVTMYTKGVLITDCPVQAGQSGGPIFDSTGNLIAVMVSNFKSSFDDKIYPHHNMCVPICDINTTLQKYIETNDITTLREIGANQIIIDKWKLRDMKITNKL